jgi:hypothetical protein
MSSSTSDAPVLAHPRTAGFRLSVADGITIALGAVATAATIGPLGPMAGLFPMAVGHFFLFCNVFRVRRRYELAWTAVFLVNFTAWTYTEFSWTGVLAIQLPVTAAAIALEMRSPRYHGVFAARLNPRLAEYLDGRIA